MKTKPTLLAGWRECTHRKVDSEEKVMPGVLLENTPQHQKSQQSCVEHETPSEDKLFGTSRDLLINGEDVS